MATQIDTPVTDKTWVQVVDQAETIDVDGNRMLTLAFKGETQRIATTMSQIYPDATLSSVQNVLRIQFGSIDDASMNIVWHLPSSSWTWKMQAAEVRQLEAGEYSLLKTIFYGDATAPLNPGEEYIRVLEDGASLQWQTYSVSPYRYCNEEQHDDPVVDSDGDVETSDAGNKSLRRHIEMAFTQNAQNSENNPYRWEQQNVTRQLTEAEQQIMDKVAAGVNPVFHYPIVQHTRVIETNLSSLPQEYGPDVRTGVDVIAPLPSGVSGYIAQALEPWNALSGSFIYCGQSVSYTNREVKDSGGNDQTLFTFQVVDTFEGALKPDEDFYGEPGTRWEFGIGPQPVQGN